MLLPNRTKFRKVRKGRIRGPATTGNYIAYGEYALQAQGHERITSRQIEAAQNFL
jgi:large subunit ribosomal protein L16